jgi:hypothetical protein
MKTALLRSGTTKNPLEKDDRCAGWRPRITASAGEFEFPLGFSEAASDPAKPPRENRKTGPDPARLPRENRKPALTPRSRPAHGQPSPGRIPQRSYKVLYSGLAPDITKDHGVPRRPSQS